MGAWGTKIFQDDLAQDIKETYIDLLKQGKKNEEITQKLIEEYANSLDKDEISVFWFALADIQWDYGRLLDKVKEKAISYIKSGEDLRRWKEEAEEKDYLKRKDVLKNLEQKLNSTMPKEKKVMPYRNYICPWKEGDVYAYQLKEEGENKGKYIAFIKVGNYIFPPNSIWPIVYVYNKLFDKIPEEKELESIKYLPQFYVPNAYKGRYEDVLYRCLIEIKNSTKKFVTDFIYVGSKKNYSKPNNEISSMFEMNNRYLCLIEKFEEDQLKNYENWEDIDY